MEAGMVHGSFPVPPPSRSLSLPRLSVHLPRIAASLLLRPQIHNTSLYQVQSVHRPAGRCTTGSAGSTCVYGGKDSEFRLRCGSCSAGRLRT